VVVEVPGLSQFFGCTPIGPLAWAIVAGSATVGTIAAALAPFLIRSVLTFDKPEPRQDNGVR
jgi:cation-transporting P-type ATPase I